MNSELTVVNASSRDPSRRGRKTRTSRLVLLVAVLLVTSAGIAAVAHFASLWIGFDAKTEKIPNAFPDESTRPPAGAADSRKAVNFLLVGTDTRTPIVQEAQTGQASNQRSDTMMLVHIPADRHNVYVVSIMRDTWVTIPGRGSAKINAALAFGGAPLMVQTVESLLNQRIDHVALVDMEGLERLTDAVGGVDVNVPVPFTLPAGGNQDLRFDQGPMHMDGKTALAFVHERYAFRDGDYQRVRNQQLFLKSLLGKVIQPATLANPATVGKVVNDFAPFISVDSGLTPATLASLALELKDVKTGDIVFFTLPTSGTGLSADGQSVVLLDSKMARLLAGAMSNGTMTGFIVENNLGKGN